LTGTVQKKFEPIDKKNYNTFYLNFVYKLSKYGLGIRIRDSGIRDREKTSPESRVKKAPDTGSASLIRGRKRNRRIGKCFTFRKKSGKEIAQKLCNSKYDNKK
jgi:hypothetical protein